MFSHRLGGHRRAPIAATLFAAAALAAPTSALADTLVTTAGTGTPGSIGDGSMAAAAQINGPRGLARLGDGSVLVADTAGNRIRRIAVDGTITTVAGTGVAGSIGDGGPAVLAQVNGPRDVAVAADGVTYFIADSGGNRIRRVDGAATITTVVGSGAAGFAGDGGTGPLASLNSPSGVAVTAAGGLLIADTTNSRIRLVASNIITTVAGNGTAASTGDGSPANLASINLPQDVSVATGSAFLIADTAGNRIRRVDAGGIINTVAGTGTACAATTSLCGDYGPAALAQLNGPATVTGDATGTGFTVVDTADNRVRRVSSAGTITAFIGSGTACATSTSLCGDAAPSALASLNAPRGVLDLPDGSTLVADSGTNRLRARVLDSPGPSGPAGPTGPTGSAGSAGPVGAVGAGGADGTAGTTGPKGSAGPTGANGVDGTNGTNGTLLVRPVSVAFAATKLTSHTAAVTMLRIVVTDPSVVTLRLSLHGKTVAMRRVEYRQGGRKRLGVGHLRAGTYTLTLTATDGATSAVDHASLHVLRGH
jgi:hypothetical protein